MWSRADLAVWRGCAGRGSLQLKKKKKKKSGHNLRERVNTQKSDSDSTNYVHKATKYEKHIKTKEERGSVRPLSVSPLSLTPSIMFLLTTFFTSSNAWGASGVLKHVLYMHTQHICSFQMLLLWHVLLWAHRFMSKPISLNPLQVVFLIYKQTNAEPYTVSVLTI